MELEEFLSGDLVAAIILFIVIAAAKLYSKSVEAKKKRMALSKPRKAVQRPSISIPVQEAYAAPRHVSPEPVDILPDEGVRATDDTPPMAPNPRKTASPQIRELRKAYLIGELMQRKQY